MQITLNPQTPHQLLSLRQIRIFFAILEGQTQIKTLSSQLLISKPALTRTIDRLTHFQLVFRQRDPKDHRNVFVNVTENGTIYANQLLAEFS